MSRALGLSDVLDWPSKTSEGQFRFICPICSEFNSATNPKTNLGRCFRCQKNFNPIDMVMAVQKCTFVQAVKVLRDVQRTPARRTVAAEGVKKPGTKD